MHINSPYILNYTFSQVSWGRVKKPFKAFARSFILEYISFPFLRAPTSIWKLFGPLDFFLHVPSGPEVQGAQAV